MTTTAEPDVQAWVDGEIEEPCTLKWGGKECGAPASFLAYGHCDSCTVSMSAFFCVPCHKFVTERYALHSASGCMERVTLTWVERIK